MSLPLGIADPFNLAEVDATFVAAKVTTVGAPTT